MTDYLLIGVDFRKPYWQAVLSLLERFALTQLALPLDPKYQDQLDALQLGSISLDDVGALRVLGYDGEPVSELKTLIGRAAERRITFWCIGDESEDRVRVLGERLVSLPTPVALLCAKEIAAKKTEAEEVPLGAILPAADTTTILLMPQGTIPPQPAGTLQPIENGAFDYRYFG
jgi:hypothetical protein